MATDKYQFNEEEILIQPNSLGVGAFTFDLTPQLPDGAVPFAYRILCAYVAKTRMFSFAAKGVDYSKEAASVTHNYVASTRTFTYLAKTRVFRFVAKCVCVE